MNGQSQLADNPYALIGDSVANAPGDVRAAFVRKTYTHLTAAIYALVALEWFYFQSGIAESMTQTLLNTPYGMIMMFGGFLLVSWIAEMWANSDSSKGMQYLGLSVYVIAESLFLAPILYFAQLRAIDLPNPFGAEVGASMTVPVVPAAAVTTLLLFSVLTAIAWFSKADFSFMSAGLTIAGIAAFALIIASAIFGLHLGVWFSVAMIVFACAYILYDTSNVIHKYPADKYVAASLALFASVALLFWYVLRLFMAFSSDD